jgi:hypothetical protein
MSQTTDDLKKELKKSLGLLGTLRDEVRGKLRVAGTDVKNEWKKLEPHLVEVERAAGEATEASKKAVTEAVRKLKKLSESL